MIRVLAVDIDGTLLDSRGGLPADHRQALAEAIASGIHVALVTGRSFHFTQPVAQALDLPVTLIVNNGAVVKSREGVTVMRQLLDRDVARHLLACTKTHEESVAVIFDRHDGRQIVFERMDWEHPHRRGYFEKNNAFIAAVASLSEALTEDPIQVMFNGGVVAMRGLAAELRTLAIAPRFALSLTEYERRDFSLLDVNAAGCSKGATLARWVAHLGFHARDVMAVGDNLNDLDMLRYAGTAVIMANAADALLRDATGGRFHRTGTNDENGLAQAIRRWAVGSPGASGAR
jgi:Cof subfamily protein (haloacid dehalogenase superfamily)